MRDQEGTAGFEQDIRPMFREKDRQRMEWAFDLWRYEDVRDNAAGILERIEDGRQWLVLHGDQLRRLLCDLRRIRGHSGDHFACEAHAIDGQHRHVAHATARPQVGQVGPR